MTSNEFLEQLEKSLSVLQADERENAMAYYREYFMEAGEDEDAAAAKLGSPQSVAQRIISEVGENSIPAAENNFSSAAQPAPPAKKDISKIILIIIIVVLTFPFWIGPLVAVLALILALCITVLALVVSGLFIPFQGIAEIISGNVLSGIFDIGSGLFIIGLAMMLWKPVLIASKAFFRWLAGLCRKIFKRG